MVMTDVSGSPTHADIKLPTSRGGVRPDTIPNEAQHAKLLGYLLSRLNSDKSNSSIRAARFARIDKDVSTWQTLSKEDSKRRDKKQATGVQQAININLPIQHTHIDDLVSFFSGVYAPNSGAFYEEPNDDSDNRNKRKNGIKAMNADAKKNKYFKELCSALRALMKYNVGGFKVLWEEASGNSGKKGSNRVCAIDMYNFFWDPAIDDPSDLPTRGEWAAEARRESRMNIIIEEQAGRYKGAGDVLNKYNDNLSYSGNANVANYYRYPPNHAGLAADGEDAKASTGSRANWASYGVGLPGESAGSVLENTHEIVEMFIRLNPTQFGLTSSKATPKRDTYVLYRAVILDATRVIAMDTVSLDDENSDEEQMPPEIPCYVGYLNQDDMGIAQRSIAELLAPFQSYGSFLLNADIAGSRGAIFGMQFYDPDMFDMSSIEAGSPVARIASKRPGTDVRAGLQTVSGNTNNGQAMDSLAKLMGLIDKFFPGQALPQQIAGIDRAVQSQVAAVMQGVNRRLHMLVRVLDDDVLGPTRKEQAYNMMRAGAEDFSGMTESDIMNMVGSGLAQLNREVAAQAMQQILFAIIQNPRSAEQYDVIGLMNFWSRMMNIGEDLEKYRLQPQTAAPGTPGAPPAAPPGATPAAPAAQPA